jgi:hypothetical protein
VDWNIKIQRQPGFAGVAKFIEPFGEISMIERLQRALEHIDELSPAAQEDLATFIEEQTLPSSDESSEDGVQPRPPDDHLPKRIRTALAAIGSARDLLDDDEFEALDRIRHESTPTPAIELDDL